MAAPRTWVFSAVVVLSSIAVATAASANGRVPALEPTAGGAALASSSVLIQRDLGSQWSPVAAAHSASAIDCRGLQPNQSALVETGLAAVNFTDYRWEDVWDTVRVFKSSAEARSFWTTRARTALIRCNEQEMNGPGQRFTALRRLSFPHSPVKTSAFRVSGTMRRGPTIGKGPDLVVPMYTDVVLLSSGRTQEVLVFGSLADPVNAGLERRVVDTLATRLKATKTPTKGNAA